MRRGVWIKASGRMAMTLSSGYMYTTLRDVFSENRRDPGRREAGSPRIRVYCVVMGVTVEVMIVVVGEVGDLVALTTSLPYPSSR